MSKTEIVSSRLELPGRRLLTCEEFGQIADSGVFGPDEHLELIEGQTSFAPFVTCSSKIHRLQAHKKRPAEWRAAKHNKIKKVTFQTSTQEASRSSRKLWEA